MCRQLLYIYSFLLLLSADSVGQTRQRNIMALSWEIGFPTENNDFLSRTSYAGGKIEYRYFIRQNFTVGGFMNWNSYYEYFPTATYVNKDETQAVTTDMYRYIYTLPFGLNAHYYFKAGKLIKPYIGLALGTQYSEQDLYYNIFVTYEENWGFLARPELGVFVKTGEYSNFGFLAGVSYAYATNKNESVSIDNLQNLNVQIGIAWSW